MNADTGSAAPGQLRNALAALVERALNQYLDLDPEVANSLATISGKVIELELIGLGRVYICPLQDRVSVLTRYEGEPDARIKSTPLVLAKLARGGDALPEGIEIEGDTEVAQTFQQTLAAVEIDWEDLLSKGLGDIAAHQVGNVVRGFKTWAARAGDSTVMNTSEYLQEESRLLPTREEVELFMNDVDTLRDDVERLAARVERLITKKASSD